jgi:hypothetical protein
MRARLEPKVHSLAPRRGRALAAICALALSAVVGPGVRAEEAAATSDAALQQRIELLERQTATLKGRLAALEAAQRRLDTRPSLETCAGFGGLAGAVGLEVADLARQYADFAALAERHPERRDAARLAFDALTRVRDEVIGHAVTVTAHCAALGVRPIAPAEARPVRLPITRGEALLAAGGSVIFWSGIDAKTLAQPGGGLWAARGLAGALDGLPDVLWVRVEGVTTDRAGLKASFLPGENAAGRSLMPQFVASPGALRGVVVVPLEGPLAETWALAGLARAFERADDPAAGCAPRDGRQPLVAEVSDPSAPAPGPMRFTAAQRVQLGLAEAATSASVGFTPAAASAGLAPMSTCGESARPHAGSVGPSVGLVVATLEPMSSERMVEIIADWQMFVAAGPDLDPTTANFFEASAGGTCRPARLSAHPGGCAPGVPDLP